MSNRLPVEESIEVLFRVPRGRAIVRRTFRSVEGETYEFLTWWHLGKLPSIVFPVISGEHSYVVAIKEFRHGMSRLSLELPGGGPEGDESPLEVAKRELLEETGYEAGQLIELKPRPWAETQAMNLRFTPFLAIDCKRVAEPIVEENCHAETVVMPIEEWYRKIFAGEVESGHTLALSLLALPYLLKEKMVFK